MARAYLDGKQYVKARKLYQTLWEEWPDESRFGLLVLKCEFVIQNPKTIRDIFDRIKKQRIETAKNHQEKLQALIVTLKEEGKEKAADFSEKEQSELRQLKSKAYIDKAGLKFFEARVLMVEEKDNEAIARVVLL